MCQILISEIASRLEEIIKYRAERMIYECAFIRTLLIHPSA